MARGDCIRCSPYTREICPIAFSSHLEVRLVDDSVARLVQKRFASCADWYMFGVDQVINHLVVRS